MIQTFSCVVRIFAGEAQGDGFDPHCDIGNATIFMESCVSEFCKVVNNGV